MKQPEKNVFLFMLFLCNTNKEHFIVYPYPFIDYLYTLILYCEF